MLQLPKFIGHRGVKALAPENTLASFNKAKALGFSWVEFDVMLTACGEAIIIHDHLLKRTTNGHGRVATKAYVELATLDAGSWFDPSFSGERIPTLKQTIACLAKLGLQANLEIKPSPHTDIATAERVVEIISKDWPATLPLPLVSSFSLSSLYAAKALMQKLPIGILYNKLPRNWQQAADELNAVSIHLNQCFIKPDKIQAIKDTGRLVLAYTVNDIKRAELLFNWGVSAVFSDLPLPG